MEPSSTKCIHCNKWVTNNETTCKRCKRTQLLEKNAGRKRDHTRKTNNSKKRCKVAEENASGKGQTHAYVSTVQASNDMQEFFNRTKSSVAASECNNADNMDIQQVHATTVTTASVNEIESPHQNTTGVAHTTNEDNRTESIQTQTENSGFLSEDDNSSYTDNHSSDDMLSEDENAIDEYDESDCYPIIINQRVSNEACCNCGRRQVDDETLTKPYKLNLQQKNLHYWKKKHRGSRKFCNINFRLYSDDNLNAVTICDECHNLLQEESSRKIVPSNAWPAFVWKLLMDRELCGDAWRLVPPSWRHWWTTTLSERYDDFSFEVCDPLFEELSTEMQLDLKALDEITGLNWVEDLMPRELSLVLPTVKCPAGCCEWKHKANDIPMDVVWRQFLGVDISMYSSLISQKKSSTSIFRNDYFVADKLLHNPKWLCKPSITLCTETNTPVVLTCRHHKNGGKGMMLHPCRSPLGTLATPKSNQFSPVCLTSRTLRKSRARAYSASFQMATMQGSYSGLDTMYLTSNGGFHFYQSRLAWKKEVLAYKGRKDLRAHITKMAQDKKISYNVVKRFEQDGNILFRDWNQMKKKCQDGSSYLLLDDAVKLYQSIRYDGTETCIIEDDAGQQIKKITMAGAWPKHIAWVHPSNNGHGRQMPDLMNWTMKNPRNGHCDTRGAWLLAAMLATNPPLWEEVVAIEKQTSKWEGWFLNDVTKHCFPHEGFKCHSSNPFGKNENTEERFLKRFNPLDPKTFNANDLISKFDGRYRGVKVYRNKPEFPVDTETDVNVIIVVRNPDAFDQNDNWTPALFENSCEWEIRFLAMTESGPAGAPQQWKGDVFCRHGGRLHPFWWKMDRRSNFPTKMDAEWNIADIDNDEMHSWTTCVFVKQKQFTKVELQKQILGACSGQSKVHCSVHDYPLICVPTKSKNRCKCSCAMGDLPSCVNSSHNEDDEHLDQCRNLSRYVCPHEECSLSICLQHFTQVIEGEQKFYVTKEPKNCYYGTHPLNLTREIRGNALQQEDHNIADDETRSDESSDGVPGAYPRSMVIESDDESDDDMEIPCNPQVRKKVPLFNARTEADDPLCGMHITFEGTTHDDCAVEASFAFQENVLDEFFVTGQGIQGNFFDALPFDNSNLEEDTEEQHVPCTNAGVKPIYCSINNEPYASNAVSNHVLLNHYGSCLVRRNSKMAGTLRHQNFLQGIASTSAGDSIPLVYPEGMLFPDHFFLDEEDGSVLGALPAAALHDDRVLKRHGLCTLQDHYRTRLSSPGLLASSDPKYHFFAFDNLTNLGMRGCDSRVILRRGFADLQGPGGVTMRGRKDPIFDTEQVDCRPIVNQLSAAIGLYPPCYFYTHTISMKTHYGIKLIWEWMMSDEILDEILKDGTSINYNPVQLSQDERDELRQSIIDSAGVLLLRAWMEIMHIWIRYITKSKEQPLGDISKFFFRFELQEAEANLPHVHSILWTNDDLKTEEGLNAALDRIRGFISDIIRKEEMQEYLETGLFENEKAITRFLEMMGTVLPHEHLRRCFTVTKNPDNNTDEVTLRCKVADNYSLNPRPSEHTFIDIPVEHSQESIHVMQTLGLCQPPPPDHAPGKPLLFEPTIDSLKAKKHVPPANGNEGIVSPVPGKLIARNPNACNIQFTTGYLISRYLAKYVASIDEYNVIKITPPKATDDPNTFNVEGHVQLNTKITGNKIHQQKKRKKESRSNTRQARAINIIETYMLLFGYDPIIKNMDFVNVPTQPFEERSASNRITPLQRFLNNDENKDLRNKSMQCIALSAMDTVPCHHVRESFLRDAQNIVNFDSSGNPVNRFPKWRRFTSNQVQKAEDDLQSPLQPDFVTLFSLRPPELRFIMHQDKYNRWFERKTNNETLLYKQIEHCSRNLNDDVRYSKWIDATCATITMRYPAIHEILDYINSAPLHYFGTDSSNHQQAKKEIKEVFELLEQAIDWIILGNPLSRPGIADLLRCMHQNLVSSSNKSMLPIPWHKSVRPTQPTRFLIHLLLSFGAFVDEYSLFQQPCLRDSFIHAGLLDANNPEESANHLCRRYITEQLVNLPAGTVTFDRYCASAYYTIKEFFVSNTLHTDEIPSVLYCRLAQETDEKIKQYKYNKRQVLIQNLLNKLEGPCGTTLPSFDECMNATVCKPCSWDINNLPISPDQPLESHEEQQKLLKIGQDLVHSYINSTNTVTKCLCVVGAGGVGKTTADQIILLHAICKGLNGASTALASERSQELAGEHINSLFCMPRGNCFSVGQLAERCIANLYRNPEKLEYLRTLDLLLLDETGNIPAEILSVMDIVLRYIRNSNKPFGGLLIIATMDNLQIEPPTGRHPLLSSLFISTFMFFRLSECVRAANDPHWRRVQEITRYPPHMLTDEVKEEFINLLVNHCTWVKSDDDPSIPANSLWVYGKNSPIRQQEQKLFSKITKTNSGITYLVSKSEDHERTVEGSMIPASQATSDLIDSKVKEPQKLYFYERGRYQITANQPGKYSNSQLAMLFKMPTQEQLDRKLPIEMLVSPPGSRYIPGNEDTAEHLITLGWKPTFIHKCRENVVNVRTGVRGTRIQYRLRHHVGSTEHSVMGQTLGKLITRVGRGRQNPYSLWMSSQVVVLLSRTKFAKDTTFVSQNPRDTAETLFEYLQQTTPFRTYIGYLLDRLCDGTMASPEPIFIDQGKAIVRPCDVELPNDDLGAAYILVSLADPNFTYIGSAKNLRDRFITHLNTMTTKQTACPSLRPWSLLAYVTGFGGEESKWRAFEDQWIYRRRELENNPHIRTTIEGIKNLGYTVIQDFAKMFDNHYDLRFVDCGSLHYLREELTNNR